jgi:hypothetical protein
MALKHWLTACAVCGITAAACIDNNKNGTRGGAGEGPGNVTPRTDELGDELPRDTTPRFDSPEEPTPAGEITPAADGGRGTYGGTDGYGGGTTGTDMTTDTETETDTETGTGTGMPAGPGTGTIGGQGGEGGGDGGGAGGAGGGFESSERV